MAEGISALQQFKGTVLKSCSRTFFLQHISDCCAGHTARRSSVVDILDWLLAATSESVISCVFVAHKVELNSAQSPAVNL